MKIGRYRIDAKLLATAATPPITGGVVLVLLAAFWPGAVRRLAPVLGPMAILLGALTAIMTAIIAASVNSEREKVKAAYESVAKKSWDKDYILARERYLTLIRNGEPLTDYLAPQDHKYQEAKDFCEAIRNIANDYELTAIAIKENIIDERFIRLWQESAIIVDFDRMKPYIEEVRKKANNRKVYLQFEEMVERWRRSSMPSAGSNGGKK